MTAWDTRRPLWLGCLLARGRLAAEGQPHTVPLQKSSRPSQYPRGRNHAGGVPPGASASRSGAWRCTTAQENASEAYSFGVVMLAVRVHANKVWHVLGEPGICLEAQ